MLFQDNGYKLPFLITDKSAYGVRNVCSNKMPLGPEALTAICSNKMLLHEERIAVLDSANYVMITIVTHIQSQW